jgi:hypothetical protein
VRRTQFLVLATHFLSEAFNFVCASQKRAQGKPGARCTRGLMCTVHQQKTHMSIQVKREHPGLPCAMALRFIRALPGEPGFVVTIAPEKLSLLQDLTPTTGASGPHDFAVRTRAARLATHTRPPQPVPTSVTLANAPLAGQDAAIRPVFCAEKQQKRVRHFNTTGKSAKCCQAIFCKRDATDRRADQSAKPE